MIDISLTPTPESLQALNATLSQLSSDEWLTQQIDIEALKNASKDHYDNVVRKLPGGGPDGFAYRTGALYQDVTQDWALDGLSATGGSDLAYASSVEGRANDKGASLFAPDQEYLDILEREIGDAVEQQWAEA
jgi:hypothetical protein